MFDGSQCSVLCISRCFFIVLSATSQLYLSIEDENDNIPMFLTEPYSATVVEMTVRESPIGVVVMATDLDSGFYGDVTYSFLQNKSEFYLHIVHVV